MVQLIPMPLPGVASPTLVIHHLPAWTPRASQIHVATLLLINGIIIGEISQPAQLWGRHLGVGNDGSGLSQRWDRHLGVARGGAALEQWWDTTV